MIIWDPGINSVINFPAKKMNKIHYKAQHHEILEHWNKKEKSENWRKKRKKASDFKDWRIRKASHFSNSLISLSLTETGV